jgi:hypothetical protein
MFESGEIAELVGAVQPEGARAAAPQTPADPQQSPPMQLG